MQNRYAGDLGDFGKLGLLRYLQSSGLSIGLNWYLAPNESHNADGRFVQYLNDESLGSCDTELWSGLKRLVCSGQRTVAALENAHLLDAVYYSNPLPVSGKSRAERDASRVDWHQKALNVLADIDIVCVDPDNGLLVPSAMGTKREIKYAKPDELSDYYRQGSSVIYYQHKARVSDAFYIERHRALSESPDFPGASGLGLKFTKTSLRYYFFIMQPEHEETITKAVSEMLGTAWSRCFTRI